MSTRNILVHGHIFKNAGTTLDWCLKRHFGSGFLDHRDDKPMRTDGADYLGPFLLSNPKLMAISSHHLCYPLPELTGVTLHAIYLFRHPIERVLSVYEFERQQRAQTPGAVNAKRMDITEYIRWRLTPESGATIRNYHVRYLAGLHRASKRALTNDDYEIAQANLHERARIGLVERYDESFVEFEYALQDAFQLDLANVPQNVNTARAERAEDRVVELRARLGEPLFREVEAANELDLSLYAEAKDLLDQRTVSIPCFDESLREFRARCERLR